MNREAERAEELAMHARRFYEQGWTMGGSGNLSIRLPSGELLVTVTGRHKAELGTDDFVRVGPDGTDVDASPRPSSDIAIHRTVYERNPRADAVYHVHEPNVVAATTRFPDAETFDFAGYTMLKAFGIEEIDKPATLPLLAGAGRAERLARELDPLFEEGWKFDLPAFVADHHGLYAWGASPKRARCHIEALAHLFECKMIDASTRDRRSQTPSQSH